MSDAHALAARWRIAASDHEDAAEEAESKGLLITAGGLLERAATLRKCADELEAAARQLRAGPAASMSMCQCGHPRCTHPFGVMGNLTACGCWNCACQQFVPAPPQAPPEPA